MSRTQFWTILIGSESTSFRARDRETLVPTLVQLQRRHPEAVIKWFERDQLFESPLEAEEARLKAEREKRPKGWRPGGDHRDPRAVYQLPRDEKRRRFKARAQHDRISREADGTPGGGPPGGAPRRSRDGSSDAAPGAPPLGGAGARPRGASRPFSSRPPRPPAAGRRPPAPRGPKKPRQE